jgi:RNA polymerase sigma-70 factor (ECF subfamily)
MESSAKIKIDEKSSELESGDQTDTGADLDCSQWISKYGNRLFGYAMFRVRQRELAEDLVQETLLSAVRARESFEGRASVYTWLVTILRNKIVDHLRKTSKMSSVSYDEDPFEVGQELFNRFGLWKTDFQQWGESPESLLDRKQFRSQIEHCIEKLPQRYREAFIFKVVDGLGTDEICDMLGISANNLWVILYRARMGLRKCLDENWFAAKPGGELQ